MECCFKGVSRLQGLLLFDPSLKLSTTESFAYPPHPLPQWDGGENRESKSEKK